MRKILTPTLGLLLIQNVVLQLFAGSYCQDFCEKCLKPATQAFNTVHENHTYTFCSVYCNSSFGNQEESNFKIDDSVSDIIQLEGNISGPDELPTFVNIKISTDKKLSILFYITDRNVIYAYLDDPLMVGIYYIYTYRNLSCRKEILSNCTVKVLVLNKMSSLHVT